MRADATFAAWIFFALSHAPACSPNTIPNNPSRATIGGAGLFTRMTPYKTPTSRPTVTPADFGVSFMTIAPIEAEHLLGFRLSGRYPAIRIHGILEGNDLDRRRF